jgi:hypothetical protein
VRAAALDRVLEGALTREETALHIGVTPQAVSERLKNQQLTAIRRGREWRFPSWQFSGDGTVPELGALIQAWPGTALALSTWALTQSVDLMGRTPAEMLRRRNGSRRVVELASATAGAAAL